MTFLQSLLILIIIPLIAAVKWAIIIGIIFSWLVSFGIMDTRNQMVYRIYSVFDSFMRAVTGPFRRLIPPLGGLDFSPLIVIFGLHWMQFYLAPKLITMLG